MIIYFADRKLNILGQASTTLPRGFLISDDVTTEDVDTGFSTFSCKISYNNETRAALEDAVKVGGFILKGSGHAFEDKENTYDSLYTIIETEFDTGSQQMSIYAEDGGLDLLNKIVKEGSLTGTIDQMIRAVVPSGWSICTYGVPTTKKTHEWDGENTATERVNSIANLWECEVYYSFVVERFQISEKVINVVNKRGNQNATVQLRLNRDVKKIAITTSIEELVTAYEVTGGTPSNSSNPINLKNYNYNYTDPKTGDKYAVDKSTGQMRNTSAMVRWSSAIDNDGLIVKTYSYDTTDKATLAGQARAELQKNCNPIVNYDIDLFQLPGARIGDRVNVIDADGELYIEARLLKIETSVADRTQKVVIGDYLIKSSGISERIEQLASQFAETAQTRKFFTWIVYADNEQGDGISMEPAGKNYMALLPNQLEELTDIEQAEAIIEQFKWLPYQSCAVYIESTNGTSFKNTNISTQLNATVYRGGTRAGNITQLKSLLGADAELKWYELVGGAYQQITDSRVVNNGFSLNINSTGAVNIKCEVYS